MRKTLFAQPIIDVAYYTYALTEATLAAAGDCNFVPYVLLVDASSAQVAATPKELARILSEDEKTLLSIAEAWEAEGLLERTRSPLDARCAGFSPTLMGIKHARTIDELLYESLLTFWRCDSGVLDEFVKAIRPFQKLRPRTPFEDGGFRLPLRALCALHSLVRDYRAFAHSNVLTFSEMHLLLCAERYGVLPGFAIYRDRNQFSLADFHATQLLLREKHHLEPSGGNFVLSDRGRGKVAELHAQCNHPTRNKSEGENDVASQLEAACDALRRCATEGACEDHVWEGRTDI